MVEKCSGSNQNTTPGRTPYLTRPSQISIAHTLHPDSNRSMHRDSAIGTKPRNPVERGQQKFASPIVGSLNLLPT